MGYNNACSHSAVYKAFTKHATQTIEQFKIFISEACITQKEDLILRSFLFPTKLQI